MTNPWKILTLAPWLQWQPMNCMCRGHDVFNALDIFENDKILKDLKFGIGDGRLRYYLYNWRVAQELKASQIGLVLL